MTRALQLFFFVLLMAVAATAHAGLVLNGGGLLLAEQAGTFDVGNLAPGGSAFALDIAGQDAATPPGHQQPTGYGGAHTTVGVNNVTYGNSGAWLAGSVNSFVGINLGATEVSVSSIAFGRSNVTAGDPCGGGVCMDRWPGLYTLQYTQVPNPDNTTAGWTDIGTLDYQSAGGPGFSMPWRRHRYNFDAVSATGLRLVTGPLGTGIDEMELYEAHGTVYEYHPLTLTPAAGFSITYDRIEGKFFDEEAPPAQVGAPDNLALASNGATAFGSSEYPADAHAIAHANDGYYGNSNSWLQNLIDPPPPEPNPFIGIDFAGTDPVAIETIAFGRDNGNSTPPGNDPGPGGVLVDRWAGLYTLQYTLLPDPDALTGDTGDASTGWANIGTIELLYQGGEGEALQEPWLRHEFDVLAGGYRPILATGIRILTPMGNCIDEIEVNPIPEPSTVALLGALGACLVVGWLRRRRAA